MNRLALFLLLLSGLSACSQHQVEGTVAMLASGSAEGTQPYYGPPRSGELKGDLGLTIETPPENSVITERGLLLSGRCNMEGAPVDISLAQSSLATAFCLNNRWFAPIIPPEKLPFGRFQVFVKLFQEGVGMLVRERSFSR